MAAIEILLQITSWLFVKFNVLPSQLFYFSYVNRMRNMGKDLGNFHKLLHHGEMYSFPPSTKTWEQTVPTAINRQYCDV